MKRFHKHVNFNDIIGGELDILTKKKLKRSTYSQSLRSESELTENNQYLIDFK